MNQQKNKLHKTYKSVVMHLHRHRFLYSILLILLFIYLVIKLFVTPPLLSDVSFGHAYFDKNGKLLRITLSADDKYRLYTPLSEISDYVQQATILYEDKYFRYHIGINPVSLGKATINYFKSGTRQIGASTITMQVARLKYDLNTKTIPGKIKQIAIAVYIDLFYSKDEILEAYLNLAPYGGNIESIGAASLIYFDKPASNLSKIESITLSTIPQNPTKRGLNTNAGLTNMMNMRADLVKRWIYENPNDENLLNLTKMPLQIRRTDSLPFEAPHFVNYIDTLHKKYQRKYDLKASEIHTTLDLDLQHTLEKTLKNEITKRANIGIKNAAAILVNYKTMDIEAYIGSVDYFDKSIYGENDGVRARRSPGSTLKPLIYATAVDMGYIHSMTLLKDAKINFGVYAPENSDSEYYGPVLAKDALTHSRNIPAINLLRQIGIKNFYKILSESGISNLKAPEYYGISVALGGAEVSMLELADIYATMANLGKRYDIRTEESQELNLEKQILTPEAFFIVLDMLARQSTPTKNIPFAKQQTQSLRHYWKTGTSSSFRDAWTAGIFSDYVLIIWVGNFDGTPNNSFSGAKTAAPIYFSLAKAVEKYFSSKNNPLKNNNFFSDELNITEIEMCDKVGGLAGKYCPKKISAYFIPGKSPIETSPIYQAIPIDNATGLRACTRNPNTTHMEVYEFWDAEYLDMFKRAGIKRKTPPPFMPGCSLEEIGMSQFAPVVLSPIDGTTSIIVSDKNYETVAFQAVSNKSNTKLFWFLDEEMIGATTSGQVLNYNVKIGDHIVRIMDASGGGTSIKFRVIK